MRDTLEALAAGRLSVNEAEAELAGYVTGDAGRFDAGAQAGLIARAVGRARDGSRRGAED